jgi:hypothetical protein
VVSEERGTPEDDRHKTGSGNSSMEDITPPNGASPERDISSGSACTAHPTCHDDRRNSFNASVDVVADNIGLEDEIVFRDNKPPPVGEDDIFGLITQVHDIAVPVASSNTQDLIDVGGAEGSSVLKCFAPEGTALKWQSLFALLLCKIKSSGISWTPELPPMLHLLTCFKKLE